MGKRPDNGRRPFRSRPAKIRTLRSERWSSRGFAMVVRFVSGLKGEDFNEGITAAKGLLGQRMRTFGRERRWFTGARIPNGVALSDERALAALRLCVPRDYIHAVYRVVTEPAP